MWVEGAEGIVSEVNTVFTPVLKGFPPYHDFFGLNSRELALSRCGAPSITSYVDPYTVEATFCHRVYR